MALSFSSKGLGSNLLTLGLAVAVGNGLFNAGERYEHGDNLAKAILAGETLDTGFDLQNGLGSAAHGVGAIIRWGRDIGNGGEPAPPTTGMEALHVQQAPPLPHARAIINLSDL